MIIEKNLSHNFAKLEKFVEYGCLTNVNLHNIGGWNEKSEIKYYIFKRSKICTYLPFTMIYDTLKSFKMFEIQYLSHIDFIHTEKFIECGTIIIFYINIYIENIKLTPDIDADELRVEINYNGKATDEMAAIALDNGEVIGFESRGYIMNHTVRQIPAPKISEEKALENVSAGLKIKGVTTAIIPLEDGSEACCYQIKGIVSGKHFLTYVNTQTGYTEDVQILLETEGGTLAV